MGQYGGLINTLYAGARYPTPEVGMGVTFLYWTDRRPGTIIKVISDREIVVQGDNYERTDSNGMSDAQSYRYWPNPNAGESIYTLRKNGSWVKKGDPMKNGARIAVGNREMYYDFSF